MYEEVAGERAKTLVSATTVRVHRLPESNARFLEVVAGVGLWILYMTWYYYYYGIMIIPVIFLF